MKAIIDKIRVWGIAGILNFVVPTFNTILSVAVDVWQGIKNAIEGPINKAKDIVKGAIDKIKGFFSFKFEWPHIPLPHFSISGSANPIDWLSSGLPHISVDWYARGGFFNDATIAGVGERGTELAWPSYEPYFSKYAAALAEHMDGAGTVNYYIDGNMVAADAVLGAALGTVAQRVDARRRMGVVNG